MGIIISSNVLQSSRPCTGEEVATDLEAGGASEQREDGAISDASSIWSADNDDHES